LIVLLCIHPTWLIRGITLVAQGEDIILWGPLYFLYALHITLFFVAAFIILFRKLDKITGLVRKQTIYILSGYFCASSLAMVTNLILPWVGYFELNWLGQFFSTIAAAFTTYAILKHRLLNIKLIATEGFVLFLNLFLFIQLFLSTSGVKFVVNSIILAAVLIVSSLLVTSVRKEAQRLEEITELARSLEASNLRLQELDKQKTEFLSIASHQLRTPLSILSGYIELIKEGAYGKVRRPLAVVLRNMDESNNRLVTLVDEFLNITRIEQGTVKFDFKKQDLTHVIESVIEELEKRAEQKEVKIIWNKPDQPVLVSFDEEKIRHVVFNYLDNAIKYTEEGKITIAVKEDHDGVSFRVFDTGIGFNRTDQVNFFQKFYRGENVRGTNVNGTGLGLYVCSKFIEAHHGQVWASSQGLGKGAEFGFSIPFKQP
jgi:signal transduction histidine kinase